MGEVPDCIQCSLLSARCVPFHLLRTAQKCAASHGAFAIDYCVAEVCSRSLEGGRMPAATVIVGGSALVHDRLGRDGGGVDRPDVMGHSHKALDYQYSMDGPILARYVLKSKLDSRRYAYCSSP